MDNLVSPQWLNAHLNDPDLVVIDCANFAEWSGAQGIYRTTSGYNHWLDAHIPGSRHADFTTPGFAGDTTEFRNTLPKPEAFADAMARLGVHDAARVVFYDTGGSQWAARVWWMLRWIGFDRAAVLEGGLKAWSAAGGPLSESPQEFEPAKLTHHPRPDMFVTRKQVQIAQEDGVLLIDALSPAQFSGQGAALGLTGHIPGAVNIPADSLLDADTHCLKPMQDLAALLPQNRDQRAVLYCGSGIAAALVAFVMVRAGYKDVAIYMPGLQEWMNDPSLSLITEGT